MSDYRKQLDDAKKRLADAEEVVSNLLDEVETLEEKVHTEKRYGILESRMLGYIGGTISQDDIKLILQLIQYRKSVLRNGVS